MIFGHATARPALLAAFCFFVHSCPSSAFCLSLGSPATLIAFFDMSGLAFLLVGVTRLVAAWHHIRSANILAATRRHDESSKPACPFEDKKQRSARMAKLDSVGFGFLRGPAFYFRSASFTACEPGLGELLSRCFGAPMMCLPPEYEGGSLAGNESSTCRSIATSRFFTS